MLLLRKSMPGSLQEVLDTHTCSLTWSLTWSCIFFLFPTLAKRSYCLDSTVDIILYRTTSLAHLCGFSVIQIQLVEWFSQVISQMGGKQPVYSCHLHLYNVYLLYQSRLTAVHAITHNTCRSCHISCYVVLASDQQKQAANLSLMAL